MGPGAGCAAIPGEEARALREVDDALALAADIGAGAVHILAGRCDEPDLQQYYRVLKHAASSSAERTILIEPICRAAIPDYALTTLDGALAAIAAVAVPNLKIMFDRYHIETAHGDAAALLRHYRDHIGHVQIASVPARATPDAATLEFVRDCAKAGWATPFGCEYRPGADEVIRRRCFGTQCRPVSGPCRAISARLRRIWFQARCRGQSCAGSACRRPHGSCAESAGES
jgi:2-dehydrotetronate isomerase